MRPTDFRIFLDMDGVVADWMGKAARTFGLNMNSHYVTDLLSDNHKNLDVLIDEKKMWEVIDAAGDEWWADIPKFPWADYLYIQLSKLGHVCFLSQPSMHGSAAAGKMDWLHKHFQTRNYLLGAPKEFCASRYSFLVDDNPKKIAKFSEAGGHGIEFPNAIAIQSQSIPLTRSVSKRHFPHSGNIGFDEVDAIVEKIKALQADVRRWDEQWDAAAAQTYIRMGKFVTKETTNGKS